MAACAATLLPMRFCSACRPRALTWLSHTALAVVAPSPPHADDASSGIFVGPPGVGVLGSGVPPGVTPGVPPGVSPPLMLPPPLMGTLSASRDEKTLSMSGVSGTASLGTDTSCTGKRLSTATSCAAGSARPSSAGSKKSTRAIFCPMVYDTTVPSPSTSSSARTIVCGLAPRPGMSRPSVTRAPTRRISALAPMTQKHAHAKAYFLRASSVSSTASPPPPNGCGVDGSPAAPEPPPAPGRKRRIARMPATTVLVIMSFHSGDCNSTRSRLHTSAANDRATKPLPRPSGRETRVCVTSGLRMTSAPSSRGGVHMLSARRLSSQIST
mmetsp:Transcript_21944/g.76943  ORF Transcript_21944/g.76943 Transcript_21944/m.76943 type:complete len:326 (+) Transcript_21944:3227-4204(+)